MTDTHKRHGRTEELLLQPSSNYHGSFHPVVNFQAKMYEQEFDRLPTGVVDISDRWNHMKNRTES